MVQKLIFAAFDTANGIEPWITDGTAAGTTLLKDIRPGTAQSLSPSFYSFRSLGNSVVFRAQDGLSGDELWVTDGTAAGTQLLVDINPGTSGSNVQNMTVLGTKAIFTANDGVHGNEVWVTDGTAAGTQLLVDALPGATGAVTSPLRAQVVGTKMVFAVGTGDLFTTDGTPGGTTLLTSGVDTPAVSFLSAGGNVFFSKITIDAGNNAHRELWASDGVTAHRIADAGLINGPELVSINPLVALGNKMLVQASIAGSGIGNELYISDGASLTLVKNFLVGTTDSNLVPAGPQSQYLTVGANCFFTRTLPGAGGVDLWVTDGTTAGTIQLTNFQTQLTGQGRGLTQFGNSVVFSAGDSTHGFETWISDGTVAGTHILKDINPGLQGSDGAQYTVFNGKLFFSARDASGTTELWTSDGTEAGTVLFKDIDPRPGFGSNPGDFKIFGTSMVFSAVTVDGRELWITDGTAAGTVMLKDIALGQSGNFPPQGISGMLGLGSSEFTAFNAADPPPNTAPTAVNLSALGVSLAETASTSTATKMADITIADDGQGTNVLGLTGADAAFFQLVGNALFLKAGVSLNFEAKSAYQVQVAVDDASVGGTPDATSAVFTLTLTDVNEPAAVAITPAITTVAENTALALHLKVADVTVSDDALGSNTVALGGADAAFFELIGTELFLKAGTLLNFESKSSYQVAVTADDPTIPGSPDVTSNYTLSVTNVNEAPSAVALLNAKLTIAESTSTALRVKVADISVTDDALGARNLSLTGADAARFEILGSSLFLKAGTVLDFESAKKTYSVTVNVDDPLLGASPDASVLYTLAVTNVTPERINGTANADVLRGGTDIDQIFGLGANDQLFGFGNNDVLTGGLGRDVMSGGLGRDTFDFNSITETGKTTITRDVITDFVHATDKIDLATIDANGALAGLAAFRFLAAENAAFTKVAGQLRWMQVNPAGTLNDKTIIEGDINGDGRADFQIELKGVIALTAADFIL